MKMAAVSTVRHPECRWDCGPPIEMKIPDGVTPAKAGVHCDGFPLPAFTGTSFAGMTCLSKEPRLVGAKDLGSWFLNPALAS